MTKIIISLEDLNALRRAHDYCDDSWYSCPKAEGGCSDKGKGDECDCGADRINAKIDAMIASAERVQ